MFVLHNSFAEEEAEAQHKAAMAQEKDKRGQLSASSRGLLLGEKQPAPLEAHGKPVASVFDLMSQEDRARILGGAALAQQQPPPMQQQQAQQPLAQQPHVYQGMQTALAKRFTVTESTGTVPCFYDPSPLLPASHLPFFASLLFCST